MPADNTTNHDSPMSDIVADATLDDYQSSPDLSSQPDSEFDALGIQIIPDLYADDFDPEIDLSSEPHEKDDQRIPSSFPVEQYKEAEQDDKLPKTIESDGALIGGTVQVLTGNPGAQIQPSADPEGSQIGTEDSTDSRLQAALKPLGQAYFPTPSPTSGHAHTSSDLAQSNRASPPDNAQELQADTAAPAPSLQYPQTGNPGQFPDSGEVSRLPVNKPVLDQQNSATKTPTAKTDVSIPQKKPPFITIDIDSDDDDDVIFVRSEPRKDLDRSGSTVFVKEEPQQDDRTLPEIAASKPSGRPPSKGITLRQEQVKRVQAKMMEKMRQGRETWAGASTVFGKHSSKPARSPGSLTQNSAKNTYLDVSSSSRRTGAGDTAEVDSDIIMIDDGDTSWMNREIDEDEDYLESIENTSRTKKSDDPRIAALEKDVDLIRAANEKELRKRRRQGRPEVNETEPEDEDANPLFFPDATENVHKQRQQAAKASQRYKTPFTVGDQEIEDFDHEDTAGRSGSDKRQKTGTSYDGDVGNMDASIEASRREQSRTRASSEDRDAEADDGLDGEINTANPFLDPQFPCAKTSGPKLRQKSSPRPKTAKERFQQRQRTQNGAAAPKAAKNSRTPKVSKAEKQGKTAKGKTKTAPKKTAKAKSTKKLTKKNNGQGDQGEALLHGLFYNDAIQQRINQGDYGLAPRIQEAKSKERMLKELIASVPKEHQRIVTNDKTRLLRASKNFGFGKISAKEGRWLLKGMKTSLYHHQLLGADWMLDREFASTEKGGIQADAMGLGKTLQILAVMVANPPEPHSKAKTTLLVVPSSVIEQWLEEIRDHVEENLFPKIVHYKKSKELSLEILRECDIIITSYAEVVASYPYPNKKKENDLLASDVTLLDHDGWLERGPLHRISYHRVILDEAHVIKNYKSKTSLTCCKLIAKHRWAMSGTPFQNRIEEVYGYLRFLGAQYTQDYHEFRKEFCDPDSEDCNARLLTVVSAIMIRRTNDDKMFDRPILDIPITHIDDKPIDFSPMERCLYGIIEDKFRSDFNTYVNRGDVAANYRNMMVKLLRLRQLTAHPFLIEQTIRDILSLDDLRKLESKLKEQETDNRPFYEKIGQWVKEGAEAREFGRSNFGTSFPFEKYLNTLDEAEMMTRCICGICHDIATDPQITDCHHVFCLACIQQEAENCASLGHDFSSCRTCGSVYGNLDPWPDTESKKASATPPSTRSINEEGSGNCKDSTWLGLEGEILPSAKTIALKAQIMKWLREDENKKIVIFTQFRLMAKIIGKFCKNEGWGVVHSSGEMDTKARHRVVKQFNDDTKTKIMIAGLKCGGQGLNLTMACRVVCIDLWWNHSIEQQAFGRVFRLGQQHETHLMRFVVRGTVDDRLLNMQKEKSRVVDHAMMDDGSTPPKLSVEELASLFGYLTVDKDGNKKLLPYGEEVSDGGSGSQVQEIEED